MASERNHSLTAQNNDLDRLQTRFRLILFHCAIMNLIKSLLLALYYFTGAGVCAKPLGNLCSKVCKRILKCQPIGPEPFNYRNLGQCVSNCQQENSGFSLESLECLQAALANGLCDEELVAGCFPIETAYVAALSFLKENSDGEVLGSTFDVVRVIENDGVPSAVDEVLQRLTFSTGSARIALEEWLKQEVLPGDTIVAVSYDTATNGMVDVFAVVGDDIKFDPLALLYAFESMTLVTDSNRRLQNRYKNRMTGRYRALQATPGPTPGPTLGPTPGPTVCEPVPEPPPSPPLIVDQETWATPDEVPWVGDNDFFLTVTATDANGCAATSFDAQFTYNTVFGAVVSPTEGPITPVNFCKEKDCCSCEGSLDYMICGRSSLMYNFKVGYTINGFAFESEPLFGSLEAYVCSDGETGLGSG